MPVNAELRSRDRTYQQTYSFLAGMGTAEGEALALTKDRLLPVKDNDSIHRSTPHRSQFDAVEIRTTW
jgi:hypothetical protein